MLGDMKAIEAEFLRQRDIANALIELRRQRPVVAVNVIENPELH
jgi:hypothetical protein